MLIIEQAARALRATAGTNDLTGWLTAYNDLCAAVDANLPADLDSSSPLPTPNVPGLEPLTHVQRDAIAVALHSAAAVQYAYGNDDQVAELDALIGSITAGEVWVRSTRAAASGAPLVSAGKDSRP